MEIDVRRAVHGARTAGPRLRMGLGKLSEGEWLELDHPQFEAQLAEKERLLATTPERFVVVHPEADAPAIELLSLVESERARAGLPPRVTPALTGRRLADAVWLRSERQTLRRLPETGAVVFAIGIDVEPLPDVMGRTADAALFADTLEQLSPELTRYKGIETIRPALIDLLRASGGPTA
ncbi:MAG: DUF3445 domain-containing protein [Actinomycetia bacterium]|nr:DUF3445 domain-containing protein [Actinomycetes bacterium]